MFLSSFVYCRYASDRLPPSFLHVEVVLRPRLLERCLGADAAFFPRAAAGSADAAGAGPGRHRGRPLSDLRPSGARFA